MEDSFNSADTRPPRPKYKTQLSPQEYQEYKKERKADLKEAGRRYDQPDKYDERLVTLMTKARKQSLRAKFGMNPRPNIWEIEEIR